MIKGVYRFKIEALDIEEEIVIKGQHTWQDVNDSFIGWVFDKCGARIDEVSYTEK